ncbi:MAG: hypothetical protein WC526_00140 [Patescibacteria group bacterium]
MDDQIEQEKQSAWEAENDEIKILLNDGAEKYFKTEFPDLKHAFVKDLQCVVCMDEGTAFKDYGGENKFCLAGSGILFPANSEEERIAKTAKMFVDLGITEVTSHEGCGAAGLAYKRDFPGTNPTAEQIENYAKNWSKMVAEEMGRLGHEENYNHIPAEEMERPAEFHVARVVYYDGIGGFNPNREIGLPMGFIIERKHLPADYTLEELKVAINIAFGHHGFGEERFSKDLPFVIIPMSDSQTGLEDLKKEITAVLGENNFYQEEKVKVDGLIV